MSLFYPSIMLNHISDISPEQLKKLKITALMLDVDNTLATHNNPEPDAKVMQWLELMRKNGIRLVIASNNSGKRVSAFAEKLGLDFVSRAAKPLPIGFMVAAKRMKLPIENVGIVGDQIFTDILGGNLFGAKTFLVKPIEPEKSLPFRFKRKLEKPILNAYARKTNKRG